MKITITPSDDGLNTIAEAKKIITHVMKSQEKLLLSISECPQDAVVAIGEISLQFVVLVPDEDQQQGGQDA